MDFVNGELGPEFPGGQGERDLHWATGCGSSSDGPVPWGMIDGYSIHL